MDIETVEPKELFNFAYLAKVAMVKRALEITEGNQVKAAKLLKMNRSTLRKYMP